jgi:hypothetical protein
MEATCGGNCEMHFYQMKVAGKLIGPAGCPTEHMGALSAMVRQSIQNDDALH